MKPNEPKPSTVFRVIDKKTGGACSAYSRACCDEVDFGSVESARNAMCNGEYKSKGKYRVAKYRVTYTLIDPDCDKAEGVKDPPPDPMVAAMIAAFKKWSEEDVKRPSWNAKGAK